MTEKVQAAGQDGKSGDATGAGHDGAGESGGGAYPNPHTGKKGDESGFMGHGGQTDIGHYGGDDLDGKQVDDKKD